MDEQVKSIARFKQGRVWRAAEAGSGSSRPPSHSHQKTLHTQRRHPLLFILFILFTPAYPPPLCCCLNRIALACSAPSDPASVLLASALRTILRFTARPTALLRS